MSSLGDKDVFAIPPWTRVRSATANSDRPFPVQLTKRADPDDLGLFREDSDRARDLRPTRCAAPVAVQ